MSLAFPRLHFARDRTGSPWARTLSNTPSSPVTLVHPQGRIGWLHSIVAETSVTLTVSSFPIRPASPPVADHQLLIHVVVWYLYSRCGTQAIFQGSCYATASWSNNGKGVRPTTNPGWPLLPIWSPRPRSRYVSSHSDVYLASTYYGAWTLSFLKLHQDCPSSRIW